MGGMVLTTRLPVLARRLHKWLALFVGVQAVIWTVSGVYMTAVHIDFIHGDHLVRSVDPPPTTANALIDPLVAARAVPGAQTVRLQWLLGTPVYAVAGPGPVVLLDAATAAMVPPPSEAQVREIARRRYTGKEAIVSAVLLRDVPFEVRGRRGPLWRIEFAHWNKPTFYISAETGELLTRRHELWRVFDFLFGLHIMDYQERENVNNLLLRAFSWSGLALAISGTWLLVYSFSGRKRRKAAA